MAYSSGTTTTYHDLLEILMEFMTGNSLVTAAVAAGGTGYTVGDILTLTGGTFRAAARLEVRTVSAGVITGVRIFDSGIYSANPSSPTSVTGGTGTGATFTTTFAANGWTLQRETQRTISAVVAAGGTGYTVGDVLTLVGGIFTTAATFTVATVSAGVILTVTATVLGNYHATPTNPVSVTGGTGIGATLTVTYQDVVLGTQKEVILRGNGGGSDNIYVGVRTFTPAGGVFNWELAGMTGYNQALAFKDQVGLSPGRYDGVGNDADGAYLLLNNSSMTYFISLNSRHVKGVVKVGTGYMSFFMGWANPFATAAEYPFPMYIAGVTSVFNRAFGTNVIGSSGITDPIGGFNDLTRVGPAFLHQPGGGWVTVQNSFDTGTGRTQQKNQVTVPPGHVDTIGSPLPADDQFFDTDMDWNDIIPQSGAPGTAGINIIPTPRGGGIEDVPLYPVFIIQQVPLFGLLVELPDLYWHSTTGSALTLVSEDLINQGEVVYTHYQQAHRTDRWAGFAMKKTV